MTAPSPDADVIAAIAKLFDRTDAQALLTRRIVEGLAQRQAKTYKAVQELKDLVLKSNVEARMDVSGGWDELRASVVGIPEMVGHVVRHAIMRLVLAARHLDVRVACHRADVKVFLLSSNPQAFRDPRRALEEKRVTGPYAGRPCTARLAILSLPDPPPFGCGPQPGTAMELVCEAGEHAQAGHRRAAACAEAPVVVPQDRRRGSRAQLWEQREKEDGGI